MKAIIDWVFILFLLYTAYPWASWLTTRSALPAGRGLRALTALALSVGVLTLLMFWMGAADIPYAFPGATLPYLIVMLAGWNFWRFQRRTPPIETLRQGTRAARWVRAGAILIFVMISAAVLYTALYWPFYRDDTLGIYMPQAQEMYHTGTLIPLTGADSLYKAYPMLVQLAYTYTYTIAGWEHEYLAKLIPALLSLGCLGAVYQFGKLLNGRLTGWIAAVLLALTPAFGRWASSGYVDLPMAFFYTLASVFALRLRETRHWSEALLAGLMLGLAAWTKNAGLIGVPLLGTWLIWLLVERRIGWRHVFISLAACALVAAPWYLRNLIGAGFLIPATAWTDQAQRSLETLLVFVTRPENFGLPGLLIVFTIPLAVIEVLRQRGKTSGTALTLLLTLPFFAAWWLFVSYDPRFLLLFLPLLCALAAIYLVRVWEHVPTRWQQRALVAVVGLALALAAINAWYSADYKDEFLRAPLMDDAAKRALVRGE
jgi:4-amino-4-deoxy-L-arabinose transferase-like glycosyltransferase